MSCRRQRILIEGSTPDPKCELIISSFHTLPHLLDCFICSRNAMSIVLLLQIVRVWDRLGWLLFIRVWVGDRGGYHLIVLVFFIVLFNFVLSRSQSLYLYLGDWSMMATVSVSLSFLCFLCLWFI